MEWIILVALPCLLLCMVLIGKMRRMRLERNRLRYERDEGTTPVSLDAWRQASDASLRASHARRGIVNGEEDNGSAA